MKQLQNNKYFLINISRNIIILTIIIILAFLVILVSLLYIKFYKNEYFDTQPTNPHVTEQQIDRTKLYGSLFLDKLNETVKNLSNPDIKYEEKRIELNNYSDILL